MVKECPICKKNIDLEYDGDGLNDDSMETVSYPVKCCHCGFTGLECYKLEFLHYTDLYDKIIK